MWDKLAEAILKAILNNPELLERIVTAILDQATKNDMSAERERILAGQVVTPKPGITASVPSAW